jgi:hypothetical protein
VNAEVVGREQWEKSLQLLPLPASPSSCPPPTTSPSFILAIRVCLVSASGRAPLPSSLYPCRVVLQLAPPLPPLHRVSPLPPHWSRSGREAPPSQDPGEGLSCARLHTSDRAWRHLLLLLLFGAPLPLFCFLVANWEITTLAPSMKIRVSRRGFIAAHGPSSSSAPEPE